jgi:hypothetical protein
MKKPSGPIIYTVTSGTYLFPWSAALGRLLCRLGYHDTIAMPAPLGYMGGIWSPRRCVRIGCDYETRPWLRHVDIPMPPSVRPPRQVCKHCGR